MPISAPLKVITRITATIPSRPPAASVRWWREPVLHFILIGAAVFGIYEWRRPPQEAVDAVQPVSRRVVISEAKLRDLMYLFEQNEGRKPSHAELTKAGDDWAREEILSRSALLVGLDRNDPVIRQRLVKLMQWYLAGSGGGGEPGEDELRQYFTAHQERYRTAYSLVFEQIFFCSAKRGPTALTDARTTLDSFQAGRQTGLEVAIGHGDSLGGDKAEEEMQRGTPADMEALFGKPFVDTLLKAPFERWLGPYQSPMGWHVVRRRRPENPTFEEMRLKVRSEILAERAKTSPENSYEELRKRYEIEMAEIPDVRK